MLASSSVGTTELRSIVKSMRDSNPTVRFLEGTGVQVDIPKNQLCVKLGQGSVVEEEKDYEQCDDKHGGMGDDGSTSSHTQQQALEIVTLDYDLLVYAAGAHTRIIHKK